MFVTIKFVANTFAPHPYDTSVTYECASGRSRLSVDGAGFAWTL
jgi:hypothetical protein